MVTGRRSRIAASPGCLLAQDSYVVPRTASHVARAARDENTRFAQTIASARAAAEAGAPAANAPGTTASTSPPATSSRPRWRSATTHSMVADALDGGKVATIDARMDVLITGAGGLIGGILRRGLPGADRAVRGLDHRLVDDPGVLQADVMHPGTLAGMFTGVEAVVDLASRAGPELAWDEALLDCQGRINVLEAARAQGVRRYIFASSNRVTGRYESEHPYAEIVSGSYSGLDPAATPLISVTSPARPDGPYAVGKCFGEAAGRYYSEQYELSCICLRIGSVNVPDRPTEPREFATLLTHRDLVHLVDCALRAPRTLRYGVYYGVSANTWRFWDIENAAQDLGFLPRDDAERFRASLPS